MSNKDKTNKEKHFILWDEIVKRLEKASKGEFGILSLPDLKLNILDELFEGDEPNSECYACEAANDCAKCPLEWFNEFGAKCWCCAGEYGSCSDAVDDCKWNEAIRLAKIIRDKEWHDKVGNER